MELEWNTIKELKALCQQQGLDSSGSKQALISRLKQQSKHSTFSASNECESAASKLLSNLVDASSIFWDKVYNREEDDIPVIKKAEDNVVSHLWNALNALPKVSKVCKIDLSEVEEDIIAIKNSIAGGLLAFDGLERFGLHGGGWDDGKVNTILYNLYPRVAGIFEKHGLKKAVEKVLPEWFD